MHTSCIDSRAHFREVSNKFVFHKQVSYVKGHIEENFQMIPHLSPQAH